MVFQSIKQRFPPSLRRSPIQSNSNKNGKNDKSHDNSIVSAINPSPTTHPKSTATAPTSTTTSTPRDHTTTATTSTTNPDSLPLPPFTGVETPVAVVDDLVIAGGGIVGLVMALALHHHHICRHNTIHIYEQAPAFHEDVGAGMGLYPNGLRVIRDISPTILKQLQDAGCPYQFRRWMRHDGTEVAVADETVLTHKTTSISDDDLQADMDIQPIGIRRWKLQKILYDAATEVGIVVHFGKRLDTIQETTEGILQLRFEDGTTCSTKLLLAADGAKSKIRDIVTKGTCNLKYTGTTCLMGTSTTPRHDRGLSLPSSPTTKCHGAFYATGAKEQCFQLHFPTTINDVSDAAFGGWGGLTHTLSQDECQELSQQLQTEGWDAERFLQPLQNVDKALRIGLMTLDPPLQTFTFGRVILLGDAAHPPVPYLGQGAQQGLEDAGTLALLLKRFCVVNDGVTERFSLENIQQALNIYNGLRVPRTNEITERGKLAGMQQQKRADNPKYNHVRETLIQREVFYNKNSSHLFPGVQHDYRAAVEASLQS